MSVDNFWDLNAVDYIVLGLAPVSVFGGYKLGRWLRSTLQRIQEDNLRGTNNSFFEVTNIFDDYFKYFYKDFENKFRKIENLNKEFLPKQFYVTIIAGEILSSEEFSKYMEGTRDNAIIQSFEEFKSQTINETIKSLEKSRKKIIEISESNEAIVYGRLKQNIVRYMDDTLDYMYDFKNGKHDNIRLFQRRESAKRILGIIKGKKIKQDYEIKEFKTKWTKYIKSSKSE